MHRLKPREIAAWRAERLSLQGGKCSLCGLDLDASEAVADHCHKVGAFRGVLHRGCNAWLGKIENSVRINKMHDKLAFLLSHRVLEYMQSHLDVLHPSWRTPEEKRLRRNRKAKKQRANRKPK